MSTIRPISDLQFDVANTGTGAIQAGAGIHRTGDNLTWLKSPAIILQRSMLPPAATFLTDRSQVVANRAVRRKMLQGNEPASTVMIAETVDGKWLLEIEAIAAE
jgi:hypothetical protein